MADRGGNKIGFSNSVCRPAMQARPSGILRNWLWLFTHGLSEAIYAKGQSESAIGRLHGGPRHDNPIKGGVLCGSDREVVGRSACEVALVKGTQKRSGVVCNSFCGPQTFDDSKACMHRASRKPGTAVLNACNASPWAHDWSGEHHAAGSGWLHHAWQPRLDHLLLHASGTHAGDASQASMPASTVTCALCAGSWFLHAALVVAHVHDQLLIEPFCPAVAGLFLETACAADTPDLQHVPKAAKERPKFP